MTGQGREALILYMMRKRNSGTRINAVFLFFEDIMLLPD